MKRSNTQELVLDSLPQLYLLEPNIVCSQNTNNGNYEDNDVITRSITLELPSLEMFTLNEAYFIKTCTLICPKLVYLDFYHCWETYTFNFNGGARLKDLDCKSTHCFSNECNIFGKQVVDLCPYQMPFEITLWFCTPILAIYSRRREVVFSYQQKESFVRKNWRSMGILRFYFVALFWSNYIMVVTQYHIHYIGFTLYQSNHI